MKKIRHLLLLLMFFIIGYGNVMAANKEIKIDGLNDDYPLYYLSDTDYFDKYVFSPKFSGSNSYTFSESYKDYKKNKETCNKNDKKPAEKGCLSGQDGDLANFTYQTYKDYKENNNLKDFYVIYKKVGYVDGKAVNMKIELADIIWSKNIDTSEQVASFKFSESEIGIANWVTNGINPVRDAEFRYNIIYYYDSPDNPINDFKSLINFTDMDYEEKLSFSKNNYKSAFRFNIYDYLKNYKNIQSPYLNEVGKFDHVYLSETDNRFYINTNQNLVMKCSGDDKPQDVDCKGKGQTTKKSYLYSSTNGSKLLREYLKTEKINASSFYKKAGTVTAYLTDGKINIGWSGYYTSLQESPFIRVKEKQEDLIKKVWYDNENYENKEIDITDGKKKIIKYTLDLNVPKQNSEWYYSEWIVKDTIPSALTLSNISSNVRITNKADGSNVKGNFKIDYDENSRELKISANENKNILNKSSFYGKTYVVTITTKVSDELLKKTYDRFLPESNHKLVVNNYFTHQYKFKKNGEKNNLMSNTVSFNLYKDPPPPDTPNTCESELEAIKKADYSNILKIRKLQKLYQKYEDDPKYGDGLELLFNYKYDTDTGDIDISKTSCSAAKCIEKDENDLACSSTNIYEASDAVDTNDPNKTYPARVCYFGRDNENVGSYYSKEIDAYCKVSYSYTLPFENETVNSGTLLWGKDDGKVSTMNVKITCDGLYGGENVKNGMNNKKLNLNNIINSVLPNISLYWIYASNEKKSENLSYDYAYGVKDYLSSNNDESSLLPKYTCDKEGNNDYCYAMWNGEFKVDIKYNTKRYMDSYGNFIDKNGYRFKGYGLPIALSDDKLKNNFSEERRVRLKVSNKIGDAGNKSVNCPYSVRNSFNSGGDPFCDPSVEECDPSGGPGGGGSHGNGPESILKFRTIDTSNPFPGLGANGRLVGENWCSLNKSTLVDERCSNTNSLVNKYIRKNTSNSYSTDKPMYSLTLDASDIQLIRGYNKENPYNDFSFSCINGEKCKSLFMSYLLKMEIEVKDKYEKIDLNVNNNNSSCYETRRVEKEWCSNGLDD